MLASAWYHLLLPYSLPCGRVAAFSPPPHFLWPDHFTFMEETSLIWASSCSSGIWRQEFLEGGYSIIPCSFVLLDHIQVTPVCCSPVDDEFPSVIMCIQGEIVMSIPNKLEFRTVITVSSFKMLMSSSCEISYERAKYCYFWQAMNMSKKERQRQWIPALNWTAYDFNVTYYRDAIFSLETRAFPYDLDAKFFWDGRAFPYDLDAKFF